MAKRFETMSEAKAIGHLLTPGFIAEWSTASKSLPDRLDVHCWFGFVDERCPVHWLQNRPGRQLNRVPVTCSLRETGPRPLLCTVNEVGANRIPFDVSAHGQEVPIVLNGDGFEP
jgi:hypothetical protein